MVYKLAYSSKYNLQKALINKGVLKGKLSEDENGNKVAYVHGYAEGTHAVVYLGKKVDTPATFDSDGNVLTEATFKAGYHCDIMVEGTYDFGANETHPVTPDHTFGE